MRVARIPAGHDEEALARVVDVLARRGALAVIAALRGEPLAFRVVAARCRGTAPPVVSQRLAELRDLGATEVSESGEWRLAAEGRRLLGLLDDLGAWAAAWAARTPRSLDPRGAQAKAWDEP